MEPIAHRSKRRRKQLRDDKRLLPRCFLEGSLTSAPIASSMPAAFHAIRVKSNPSGLARMILRAAELTGVLLMIGAGSAALASSPAFLGNWARGDGKTHIRVEPCGGAVCGVNTWVRPGVSGEKVGDTLVANLRPAGAGRWSGAAFDRQRNQHYTMKVHVANNRMTTAGCVFGGLMCQSMSWTRLGPAN
jgi:uncharacterized protein (DUF2147 family)